MGSGIPGALISGVSVLPAQPPEPRGPRFGFGGPTIPLQPVSPLPFSCSPTHCVCVGDADCNDLFSTGLCAGFGPVVSGECMDTFFGTVCWCRRR